jgi:hypothetical protein
MFQDCVPVCWPMRGSGASHRGMNIAAERGLAGAAGTICTPGGATRRWIASSTFNTQPTFDSRPTIHPPRTIQRDSTTATRTHILSDQPPDCTLPRAAAPIEPSRKLSLVIRFSTFRHGTINTPSRCSRRHSSFRKRRSHLHEPQGRYDAYGRHRHPGRMGRER